LWVFVNDGKGTFKKQASYKTGKLPHYLVAFDADRDGKPDLVTANKDSKDLSILRNFGNGTFDQEIRYNLRTEPTAMYAANLDADTGIDLAVVSSSSADLAILVNIYKAR